SSGSDTQDLRYLVCIVVIVFRVSRCPDGLQAVDKVVFHRHKDKRLMATAVLDVGKPGNVSELLKTNAILLILTSFRRGITWQRKTFSAHPRRAQPQAVLLDKREHLFVSNGVQIADDCKFDIAFNQPREELAE